VSVLDRVRDSAVELRDDSVHEQVRVEPRRAFECDVRGLAVRFVFGFAVAVAVGIVTEVWGDRFGGLFLAFPSILPASLTLIAEEEGEQEAKVDAGGAIIGGVAMSFFGLVSWLAIGRIPVLWAEVLAFAAWCAIAIGGYFAVRAWLRT
jgi:hypothetical protein